MSDPVIALQDVHRVYHTGRVDVRALDGPLQDVEDESHPTEVIGRPVIQRRVAWTHELAGTRLEIAALEIPGHTDLPSPRNEPRRFSAFWAAPVNYVDVHA